ncbi:hypothetical protein ACFL1H_06015 [Nanoarchaeota archaeon]
MGGHTDDIGNYEWSGDFEPFKILGPEDKAILFCRPTFGVTAYHKAKKEYPDQIFKEEQLYRSGRPFDLAFKKANPHILYADSLEHAEDLILNNQNNIKGIITVINIYIETDTDTYIAQNDRWEEIQQEFKNVQEYLNDLDELEELDDNNSNDRNKDFNESEKIQNLRNEQNDLADLINTQFDRHPSIHLSHYLKNNNLNIPMLFVTDEKSAPRLEITEYINNDPMKIHPKSDKAARIIYDWICDKIN